MKKFISVLMIVLLFSTLSGCQLTAKDIEKDMEASGEAASGEGNKASNALYKQLEIPEEVVETPLTEQGNHAYSVHAGVLVPDEAVPGIFKEHKVTVDIDYINRMADKLFDGGNYKQVRPLTCYTFDELTAMKDELLKKLADKESETYYADKTRYTEILTLLKKQGDEMTVSTYQEGDFTKAEIDDYVVCKYDEIYILEGEISGIVYQLVAYKEEGQINIRIVQMTEGYPELFPGGVIQYNLYSLSSDEDETPSKGESPVVGEVRNNSMPDDKSTRPIYEKAVEENSLKYSKEEAAKLASSFMEQLISEDMETSQTVFRTGAHAACYALRDLDETPVNNTQGNPPIDGYGFALQRKIKGLSCTSLEAVRTFTEDGETAETEQEYYEVEVSNRGVMDVWIRGPIYEVTETMKEAPELMKFSEITEIMESALKEETQFLAGEEGYEDDMYLINQIALSYVTVQYDKEYALIPVWCFQEVTNGASVGQPYLIISAVDGNILHRPEHGSDAE